MTWFKSVIHVLSLKLISNSCEIQTQTEFKITASINYHEECDGSVRTCERDARWSLRLYKVKFAGLWVETKCEFLRRRVETGVCVPRSGVPIWEMTLLKAKLINFEWFCVSDSTACHQKN